MPEAFSSEAAQPRPMLGQATWMSKSRRRVVRQHLALAAEANYHSVALFGAVWTLHHPRMQQAKLSANKSKGLPDRRDLATKRKARAAAEGLHQLGPGRGAIPPRTLLQALATAQPAVATLAAATIDVIACAAAAVTAHDEAGHGGASVLAAASGADGRRRPPQERSLGTVRG